MEGEWLEHNKNRSYPFVDGEDLCLVAPRAEQNARSLFLDMSLVYRADLANNDNDHHWRLVSVAPASTWNGTFYSTYTATSSELVPVSNNVVGSYRVLLYADEDVGLACTLVLDNDHEINETTDLIAFASPYPEIAPRCTEVQPRRVNSTGIVAGVWVDLGEIGELLEGNNIKIEVNPETALTATRDLNKSALRPDVQRIMISAIPGAGTGKVDADCSQAVNEIYTINGLPGNNGEFSLQGDDCYRVERYFVGGVTQPNALQLDNNCQACCGCDEFVALLEDIRRLKDEGLLIKDTWAATRVAYVAVKEDWEQRVQRVGDGCLSQLFGYAFTGWLITVQIWVGNVKDCIQTGASATVSFNAELELEYVPGSGMVYNTEDNYSQVDPIDNGDYSFTLLDNSAIRGGHYKLFTFSVRILATAARVAGMLVNIQATVTACGSSSVALATSVALLGNTNKA